LAACTSVDPPRLVRPEPERERAPEPGESSAGPAPAATAAPAPASAAPRWPPPAPGQKSAFCLEGVVETLMEDACYVLPDRPTKTLLVYLPGLMPPGPESPEKRTVETVVANAARRAGVAALVPRGPSRDELA